MSKEEFIKFLSDYEKDNLYSDHWGHVYSNNFDHWKFIRPSCDSLEDYIDLSCEGKVKLTYNQSLYDNSSERKTNFTYEGFLKFMKYIK
jgi:hypothetical protein